MKVTLSISNLSLILYLSINSLFVLKYGQRALPLSLVYCILGLYWVTVALVFKFRERLTRFMSFKAQLCIIIAALILLACCQSLIDPFSIKVDRWSAIHNFIYNLFHGIYPYSANTHLGGYGSPFPVWQFFHIPFFLIGNVGLSFILGTILFLDSIRRQFNKEISFQCFVLLFISPAFIYEVLVRSDLITNFLICAAIITYFYKYNITLSRNLILVGVITGAMASTRISTLIPIIIYYFPEFIKLKLKKQLIFSLIVVSVFLLTFLPFLLWDGEMLLFFEYNPFVLQTRQGNPIDFLLFVPLGIYLSLSCKDNIKKYFFNTSCMLTFFVLITFVHNMYIYENWDQLFEPFYDITYFNMALPFLILSAVLSKTYKRHETISLQ